MIRLGITGNIGGGKTTVCKIFEEKGVPVYYADQKAKELMHNSKELKEKIEEEFGKDIYPDGKLDREKLADIIFNDKDALEKLNRLVHPIVFENVQSWMLRQEKEGHSLAIEEAALTFEAKHSGYFDLMLTVVAPKEALIQRVMARDDISRKEVLVRLQNQWPQMEKALRSDTIILNAQEHSLIFQVENIIERWELPIH